MWVYGCGGIAVVERCIEITSFLSVFLRYFCPESDYFNDTSQWTSVHSDMNISGCGNYGFQNVEPSQSRAFYDWFFAKGKAVGMQVC